tara:strand:+ start:3769 stop:4434 length:666 start_codon:yes stop_codon:yes gene_type:complete
MKIRQNNKVWDLVFKKSDWGQYSSEDLIRFISKNNKKFKKKKILEVGCGTGANFKFFLDKKAIITGIDFSKIAIKKAKIKFNKEIKKGKIKLIQKDLRFIELKNKKFNFLVDNCATCCLSYNDTVFFYNNIKKYLVKNSMVYLRTFATNSWGYKSGKKISYKRYITNEWSKDLGPQRFSSLKDIKNIFKSNYEIISIEKISRTVNNQKNCIIEWIVNAKSK